MKKFLIFQIIIIVLLNLECYYTIEDRFFINQYYYYVNNSSYEVKISVISTKPLNYKKIIDSIIIPIGDTIIIIKNVATIPIRKIYPFGDSVDVKLTFFSNPPRCLSFMGEIIHDSISSDNITTNDSIKINDIRISSSYVKNFDDVEGIEKLYYIITDLHYQKSTDCE